MQVVFLLCVPGRRAKNMIEIPGSGRGGITAESPRAKSYFIS